jgi:hypothetical protein
MADLVSAAVVSGELILGLSDGSLIRAGYVQGVQGLQGPPGPIGATGRPGLDGNGILNGAGFPKSEDGKDGDFYIDVTRMALFGPKEGGVWGKPVFLRPEDWGASQLGKPVGTSGGRTFASAMGGGGSGTVVTGGGGGTGSITPILDSGDPLAAATYKKIAEDFDGDAMVVDLYAASSSGTVFIEVAASKGLGTDTGYSVVYEIQTGTNPPQLTFRVGVSGANTLQLEVSSNVALTTLRGRQLLI